MPGPGSRAYRAFVLDEGGAIRSAIVLQAEIDDHARAIAATITNAFGADLWERARFLGSDPPRSSCLAF
ncbi:hypothetical protein MMSR116_17675 [Methylobacterium mesophilicum SR1.6/6]|uniref:Uncharacterized protein n=1 Tax=Methylobacterium mesophilicum SR1.6/6 TaxID=908290 RepID=A0A6B9FUH6_9HYPH|nr:hypothetical protein MMSR116_17675 [Methylobacterium mesophilicum SR1.6/6]